MQLAIVGNVAMATTGELLFLRGPLAERYRAAAEKLAHAVAELHSKTAVSRKADYVEMRHASEQARKIMEQARHDLERHVSEHGC